MLYLETAYIISHNSFRDNAMLCIISHEIYRQSIISLRLYYFLTNGMPPEGSLSDCY